MKNLVISFIVVLISNFVSAQNDILSKEVTIFFDNVELQVGLKELQSKSGIPIAFNNKSSGMQDKINARFTSKRVEYILTEILKGKPLDYRIIGNQITIFEKKTDKRNKGERNSSISGMLIDAKSKEPLPFINVVIEGTDIGGLSNDKGHFIINGLSQNRYNVLFSAIGYEQKKIADVELDANEKLNLGTIILHEGAISLKEVIIKPGMYSFMGSRPLSMQTLSERDLKNMSFSEDITRAVSRLPGVSSNDYSSKFAVRGSETDEVLFTLDGMELYDPFHQRDFVGGLFSFVDIEVIKGVDLLTGGFSAEYGNKQSAVLNMKSKDVTSKRRSSVGVSVMNARVYTEGNYANNKGSYLFSARMGMLDQALKIVRDTQSVPNFYDMFGRLNYKLNNRHKLSLHMLHAGDKTEIRDIEEDAFEIHDTKYSNNYAWLTLQSIYNDKLSSRSIIYGGLLTQDRKGNAEKDEDHDQLEFLLRDDRELYFFGAKQDWRWLLHDDVLVKGGFDIKQLNSDYNYSLLLEDIRVDSTGVVGEYTEDRKVEKKPSGNHMSAYISGRFNLLPNIFVEAGLRYDNVSYTNEDFWSPRVSATYAISKRTFLRGAWGQYYQPQFIYNMEVNYGVDEFRKAEMTEHYVVGLEHQFSNGLTVRLEGYCKDVRVPSVSYQNLRDIWEVFPETRADIIKLDIEDARARGIEFFAKYDVGKKLSWWFSYSLAKAEEKIQNITYNGLLDKRTGWLPKAYNQKHTIYSDVNYRVNEKWIFNLSWQYYSGWPQTTYEYDFGVLEDEDDEVFFFSKHKKFRAEKYPDYHRMDLRINKHFFLRNSKLSAYIHIINLYNKKNLRKFDLDLDIEDDEENTPDGQIIYRVFDDHKYWFRTIPVIGISWEF